MPETKEFHEDADPPVRGFVHVPAEASGAALVMTHGASSNCQAPLLVALGEIFAQSGFVVLRCDLPYRQKRPHGPPHAGSATADRAGLRNAVESLGKFAAAQPSGPIKRMYLGGHSYGGRQATMLTAEDEGFQKIVQGLLLLSYPLHPPGNREKVRVSHFPSLHTQVLFVHGSRDPFGSLEEMGEALKLIPARTLLAPVENAGHDLSFRGKNAQKSGLPQRVLEAFQKFFSS